MVGEIAAQPRRQYPLALGLTTLALVLLCLLAKQANDRVRASPSERPPTKMGIEFTHAIP